MRSSLLLAIVLMASGVGADEPKKLVGTKKTQPPKLELSMPKFDALPKGEGLGKAEPAAAPTATRHTDDGPAYAIAAVTHGKSFAGTAQGLKTTAPLTQVIASGRPLSLEPFTSVVRVKSPGRQSGSIEIQILDPRGNTVMEARGELVFKNGDEAEWAVDWAPTTVRGPGDFEVQVRVAGALLGSTPLKVVEAPK